MSEPHWNELEEGIPDLSDEELDAWAEFTEAQVRGEHPDIEAYLARRPHLAERIRPSLEAAEWLQAEFDAVRRKYPGFRAWHLLLPPADST